MSRLDRNRVVPQLEILEARIAPVNKLPPPPLPPSPLPFLPIELPRTGGVAIQTGSIVELNLLNTPLPSATLIVTDGLGDVALEWDGGPIHFFSGVSNIVVNSVAEANAIAVIDLGTLPLLPPMNMTPQVNLNFLAADLGNFNLLIEHLAANTAANAITANAPVNAFGI